MHFSKIFSNIFKKSMPPICKHLMRFRNSEKKKEKKREMHTSA